MRSGPFVSQAPAVPMPWYGKTMRPRCSLSRYSVRLKGDGVPIGCSGESTFPPPVMPLAGRPPPDPAVIGGGGRFPGFPQ